MNCSKDGFTRVHRGSKGFRRVLPSRAVLLCVIAASLLVPVSAAKAVKLGTLAPARSLWYDVLMQMGTDWRKQTEGRVSLIVQAGTAGDEPTIVRKMRVGQLQAAALTTIGLQEIDEAFNAFAIPMFFESDEELARVLERMTPMLKGRLEKKGFVLLGWGHGGWVHIFSKKPVNSVADLKALRLFTSAGDDKTVQWYKNNGFSPVPLAITDMLPSLRTGIIDALPSTPVAAVSFQWYKDTKYMLDLRFGPVVGATIMTADAWADVSEPDRAKLIEAAAKAERDLRAVVSKKDAESVDVMKQRGLTVLDPRSAGTVNEWRDAAEKFATSMRGTIVPADAYDAVLRERDAFRKEAGSRGQH